MKPYYSTDNGAIYFGDALNILKCLRDESVHCCVTSPPYLGLRDYGNEPQIWDEFECASELTGIKQSCNHIWGNEKTAKQSDGINNTFADKKNWDNGSVSQGQFCQQCNAWRGSLGLEPTLELFIKHMVEIFREVKRVLRDDGTCWINLGDSYTSGNRTHRRDPDSKNIPVLQNFNRVSTPVGLKPKDMVGVPWRVAFALQSDGWYLRQDIIWHKPNPMPESIKDRCTKAHEYIFLLSKSQRYFFDAAAIKEKGSPDTHARYARGRSNNHKWADGGPGDQTIAKSFNHMVPGVNPKSVSSPRGCKQNASFSAAVRDIVAYRNKRTVWTIPPQPMRDAHFATFPERLIKPCILAGCPKGGTVLDPFFGSGTTGVVAYKHGRKFIGIELSKPYLDEIAIPRIKKSTEQRQLF